MKRICAICCAAINVVSAAKSADYEVYCAKCYNIGKHIEYEKRELAAKKKGIKKI